MKLLLLMAMTWAQEHGTEAVAEHAGHEVTIPWDNIFVQAFNFVFLFGVLAFFLRKPLKAHFAQRAQTYQELVDRAEAARKEAEQTHHAIKERLTKLESSAEQSVERARSEAAELRSRMLQEAKMLAQKLEQEAQRTAMHELEKAKAELRKELLQKALANSEETLKKSLGTNEQKKLQNEFVQKIEVVGG